MARSSYVYVVSYAFTSGVVAAFTVKHELVSWLKKNEWPHAFDVVRVPDNDFPGRKQADLSVTDLLKET